MDLHGACPEAVSTVMRPVREKYGLAWSLSRSSVDCHEVCEGEVWTCMDLAQRQSRLS